MSYSSLKLTKAIVFLLLPLALEGCEELEWDYEYSPDDNKEVIDKDVESWQQCQALCEEKDTR